jgi:hypothetical protein
MLSISGAERFVRALQTFFVAVVLVFASTAQAQTISIIGGNFQDQPAAGAMRVQVTSPPAGASIAWHVTAGQGGTLPFALTTTPIDSADTSSLSNWQSFNTANGPNGRVLSACLVPLASSPNDARYCVFFNVVGCAAFANILSGNNQAGVPGQTLPSALRIQVTDNLARFATRCHGRHTRGDYAHRSGATNWKFNDRCFGHNERHTSLRQSNRYAKCDGATHGRLRCGGYELRVSGSEPSEQ